MIVVQTEDVRLVTDELDHRLFHLSVGHLSVANDDLRIGHELLNLVGHFKDVMDAVMDEIDLPLALQFTRESPA